MQMGGIRWNGGKLGVWGFCVYPIMCLVIGVIMGKLGLKLHFYWQIYYAVCLFALIFVTRRGFEKW